ncbi:MAG: hypothetical protein WC093_07120 [Methanoculleus sp.]
MHRPGTRRRLRPTSCNNPLFEGFRAPGYEQTFPIFLAASVLTAIHLRNALAGRPPYVANPENLPLLAVKIVLLWRLRSRGEGGFGDPAIAVHYLAPALAGRRALREFLSGCTPQSDTTLFPPDGND